MAMQHVSEGNGDGEVRHRFRKHTFLLVGVVTLLSFLAAERLGGLPEPAQAFLHVLIVPMYLVWLTFTIAQVAIFGPAPTAISPALWVACLVLGLVPYALLDHLFTRCARADSHSTRR